LTTWSQIRCPDPWCRKAASGSRFKRDRPKINLAQLLKVVFSFTL
jgi:hypothetical protein